jgi:hypothetical protein
MAGKSPVTADDEQREALEGLGASRDRGEADRARAVLLTLAGWTAGNLKAHHLAHQTFDHLDARDRAIHDAVEALIRSVVSVRWANYDSLLS